MDELTVYRLAEVLQEPNLPLLKWVWKTLGPDTCLTLLTETLQTEAQGGLMTQDGSRRRTPGGVFFSLTRARLTQKQYWQFQARAIPQLTWTRAVQAMTEFPSPPGKATTMTLTIIGRPTEVQAHGGAVLFKMQGPPPPTLPRGLPALPKVPPPTWHVWVAIRQWNRVKDALAADPQDQLILEGYPVLPGTQPVLLVHTCTSISLQRAQRPPNAQDAGEGR
jgi:PHAX RNA-binding domain